MNAKTGRICLGVALLSLSLTAALWVGLSAQNDGVTVQAHTAGMQLQGMAEANGASVTSEGDKAALCAPRDQRCQPREQELVLALSNDHHQSESKALGAALDETPRKSRN
jgi:hypothetical protein